MIAAYQRASHLSKFLVQNWDADQYAPSKTAVPALERLSARAVHREPYRLVPSFLWFLQQRFKPSTADLDTT